MLVRKDELIIVFVRLLITHAWMKRQCHSKEVHHTELKHRADEAKKVRLKICDLQSFDTNALQLMLSLSLGEMELVKYEAFCDISSVANKTTTYVLDESKGFLHHIKSKLMILFIAIQMEYN